MVQGAASVHVVATPISTHYPIGRRILLSDESGNVKYEWATIVGIAPNIRQRGAEEDPEPDPVVYLPHEQDLGYPGGALMLVRGRSASGELAPLIKDPSRADYLKWLYFAAGVMEPAFGEKFFKWDVPARRAPHSASMASESPSLRRRQHFAGLIASPIP